MSVGTHDILFCAVANVRQQDEVGGLVYFDRGYHCLKGK